MDFLHLFLKLSRSLRVQAVLSPDVLHTCCSSFRQIEELTESFVPTFHFTLSIGTVPCSVLSSGAGNDCLVEAEEGSVMAPMVGATFSSFHWSPCSAREFHLKSWQCLDNYPDMPNATFVDNQIDVAAYSLDQQCRMEFGQGFSFCTSFQVACKTFFRGNTYMCFVSFVS